jgi:3-methyladenine DNA glycosylase AlkD
MESITKDKVLSLLFEHQKHESEENRKKHRNILNTKQKVISVANADVKKIAKNVLKNDYEDFLIQAKLTNKNDEYFEETFVQGLVIVGQKDIDKQINDLKWWVKKIDNWASCDSTISEMKKLKNSKNKGEYFNFFYEMCFDKSEFVARFGIVSLMTNFLEEEYISQILCMCESVQNDCYYVQMAVAWCLSYCFMKFREQTLELLKKKTLSKFVQNKTISKCRDSFQVDDNDKEMLKTLRIS